MDLLAWLWRVWERGARFQDGSEGVWVKVGLRSVKLKKEGPRGEGLTKPDQGRKAGVARADVSCEHFVERVLGTSVARSVTIKHGEVENGIF